MEHAQAPAIEAGRRDARQLAAESIACGDPTGWFEPRYAADCCSSLARDEHEDPGQMPWPLTRAEIESFRRYGLAEQFIGDFLDDGLVRRWRAWFTLPVPPDLLANP